MSSNSGDFDAVSPIKFVHSDAAHVEVSQDSSSECDLNTGTNSNAESNAVHAEQVVEKHKFVGRSRQREEILKPFTPHLEPPADVRRWSEALGLYHTNFTAEEVHKAWRAQISSPAVHPDLGGELETAILLNTSKDSLVKWLDSFTPKLGKHFLHT